VEKKEITEWHRIIFWNKAADLVGEYCKKGHRLFVEGRLETRKWQDKAGVDRYTTEVVVDSFEFVESGGGSSSGGVQLPSDEAMPAGDNFDDDIPF
jgi:single-strand DNA-binding protein